MKPEEKKLLQDVANQLKQVNNRLETFLDVYYRTNFPDKIIFEKDVEINSNFTFATSITLLDSQNLILGTSVGTKIGTSSTQKLGFFGATPVVQQASIANPSGGVTVDAEARTAIISVLSVLDSLGFTA
jgi:hypothetical protein